MIHQSFKQKFEGNNSSNKVENFHLKMIINDRILPSDLLANYRITDKIDLECTGDFNDNRLFNRSRRSVDLEEYDYYSMDYFESDESQNDFLIIDPLAFQNSRNFTQAIRIQNCDAKALNFSFLEGFQKLDNLIFLSVFNLDLADFPLLPSLQCFIIAQSTRVMQPHEIPLLATGLTRILLISNGIDDICMDQMLQPILASPTAETLKYLNIEGNDLKRIPRQIASFKNLIGLYLGWNPKMAGIFRSGSINFSSSLEDLWLDSNGIDVIKPGAIQGFCFSIYYK